MGYSGNVGWSTGAHLHLVIFLQKFKKRITLKTNFLTDSGNSAEYLVDKKTYSRLY
jgi:murein DD-endopeptidase MepM/ murein hydrolase activator NlpD